MSATVNIARSKNPIDFTIAQRAGKEEAVRKQKGGLLAPWAAIAA